MALTKAFIQLTPDSGDSFVPAVKLLSKTDFTAYVVDGSFTTSMSAPSMSGEDFQQMKNIVFTQEFKDKSTPIFFFSQSKTFCMNLLPPYLAACFSSPSAAIGLFQPTVIELHKTKGTSVIGEGVYEGNPIYPSLPSMTRGSGAASTHIKNGSTIIARPSDYGYDIDSKTATKTISISSSGWAFCKSNRIGITNDYVFKFSYISESGTTYIQAISSNSLTAEDSETAVIFEDGAASGFACALGKDSYGCVKKRNYVIQGSQLSSRLNIPTSFFALGKCFFITKVLTPQVISATSASYLCTTYNPYGIGEILTVDTGKQTVTATGSSYTAIGQCRFIKNRSIASGLLYSLGMRIVAKKDFLSGKTLIIKASHGEGVTLAGESVCYKVSTAASYSVIRSDNATDTQDDQSYLYCLDKSPKKLTYLGFLQCVKDKNSQSLSDLYDTGVIVSLVNVVYSVSFVAKIYVLYDDNSIAISSYNLTLSNSNAVCPMKISSDGKNITAYRSYLTKKYTGTTADFSNWRAAPELPADDTFIVPDNSSNSRKIEAVGVVYDSGTAFDTEQYPAYTVGSETFLILEPKT